MNSHEQYEEDVAGLLATANALLTGASDAELLMAYFETLKQFFNDSNSWQENIVIVVIPNTQDYQLTATTGRIIRLWAVTDQNNVPQAAIMPVPGLLHFLYPYTTVQPMAVTVIKNVISAFKDGRPAPPRIPDWIIPLYGNGILEGVVGRMMLESGQSYSDAKNGIMRIGRFRDAVVLARTMTARGHTVGVQTWAYPQSFKVTTQRGGTSTFNVNPSPQTAR